MNDYNSFLARKAVVDPMTGISDPGELNASMFPFQRDITSFMLKRGRGGLFAGTGLGKSFMELSWAQTVARETGRAILHLAPLAVSHQMAREAKKFGIPARVVNSPIDCGDGINITNYQKLHHFNPSDFGGVVLDESSILKSSDGKYRNDLIRECKDIPFRLAATATPAPNDFTELGNHAEFLGIMSLTDMMATFFTHDGGNTQNWNLKGHAEEDFWKWMASWSVMLRKPSDLGYANDGYDLPPLNYHHHKVNVDAGPCFETGQLFSFEANGLQERLAARRASVSDRVKLAIETTPKNVPFVWWCNLNSESDALARGIPDAVEVRGSDDDASKERKLIDFSEGRIRVLITKPSICGFGMNWQHCADTGFVGLNDSFEQYYQSVRRFWRFGQTKPVNCHIVSASTEGAVVANIRRKEADAERMADAMVKHMADLSSVAVRGAVRSVPDYNPQMPMALPNFLEVA